MKSINANKMTVRVAGGGPFAKPAEPFEPRFRPPEHPAAVELCRKFRLRQIAGEGTDFQRARRIKTWVRRQWNHGFDALPNPYGAIDLLTAARNGKSFQCGHYSQTFAECCLAVGIPARVIGLARREVDFPYDCPGNSGHIVAEVYCRDHAKWVLFDCDTNCTYRSGRQPLSALELHKAWHRNRGRGIELVQDDPPQRMPETCPGLSSQQLRSLIADFYRFDIKHLYHFVHVGTVQGYQAEPDEMRGAHCIRYTGAVHYPLAMGFRANTGETGRRGFLTDREELFNWPIDRTFIQATMLGSKPSPRIELTLQHTMPFFDHFELSINSGPFRRLRRDRVALKLDPGHSRLHARCVDRFGKPGHDALLELRLDRDGVTSK